MGHHLLRFPPLFCLRQLYGLVDGRESGLLLEVGETLGVRRVEVSRFIVLSLLLVAVVLHQVAP